MGTPTAVMGDRITGQCPIHQIPNPTSGVPQPAPPMPFSAPLTLVAHFLIAIYYAANQIPIPLVVEEERLESVSDLRK